MYTWDYIRNVGIYDINFVMFTKESVFFINNLKMLMIIITAYKSELLKRLFLFNYVICFQ